MARTLYAASPADYVINADTGKPAGGVTVTVWTAVTGGSQVTDLLNAEDQSVTTITTDSLGGFRFSGPDGTTGSLWVSVAGGDRFVVLPTTLADRGSLPSGGTTGQVLVKNSGSNYDLSWAAQTATTPSSPFTVTATAVGQVPITAQGMSGQTADLLEVKLDGGALAFGVAAGGQVKIGNGAPASGTIRVEQIGTTEKGLVIKQKASGTADPIEVTDSAGTEVFSVAADGTVAGKNIGAKVLVLDNAASVPAGTPAGTVILRRPA